MPHPALNFPKNVTVTYQVYRGWLTRGLSAWSINKVILSDSFGESYSLCQHFTLESGQPQRMTLSPGDCHEEELILLAEKASKEASAESNSTTVEIFPTFNVTDVMSLGKHIPLERNETESVNKAPSEKTTSGAAWRPMLTNSSGNLNVTSPANDTNDIHLNIGERMPKKSKTEKRSFGETDEDDLMNSMPIREDSADMDEPINDDDAMIEQNIDNKFVTVQLFQYRLGDVFEKAERYARFTLFPLLSEQFSNIFNFDASEKDAASTDSPIVIKSKAKSQRKFDIEEEVDVRSLQSMYLKVNSENHKPIEKIHKNFEVNKDEADSEVAESIHIELPTYRPPEKEKVFIPIERDS